MHSLNLSELPVDRLTDKRDRFSRPGQYLYALDGSALTSTSWLPDEIKSMAEALRIPSKVLGEKSSDLLMTEIVYPVLAGMRREALDNMGLILDLPHFPQTNRGNERSIPTVVKGGNEIPFSTAMAAEGVPLFLKGDGDGKEVLHTTQLGGAAVPVWEQVRESDRPLVAGLKTHYLTDGKTKVGLGRAAMSASMQASDAMVSGITPMTEPDIMAMTSLTDAKTAEGYQHYYKALMDALKIQFPDNSSADGIRQLGALMGTKLGPIEDGEFTNGLADRKSEAVVEKVAVATANLIKDIRKKHGISFFRMLTNGRPMPYMLRVVNRVNQELGDDIHLGTSFSSAINREVLATANPDFDQSNQLEFLDRGQAREFLKDSLEASQKASSGELDVKNYPSIFDK